MGYIYFLPLSKDSSMWTRVQGDFFKWAPPEFAIFIGPESDHWQCLSVTPSLTHSLTHSCSVNLIDLTLACEDGHSKLIEVVTVADIDAEFGADLEAEVWS